MTICQNGTLSQQSIRHHLSPKDYHRVHSAQEGQIVSLDYRPGKLWPVFPAATRQIPNLFDRNERLIFH